VKRIQLDDGTHLTQHPGGGWTWFPEERIVQATFSGSRVTVTADGSPEKILAETTIVEKAAGRARGARRKAGAAAGRPEGRPGRSEDATRWGTLNEFEDEIAPHLTLSEQAVWHYLFRWCRRNRTEASIRLLSAGRRMDYKTAAAALRHVVQIGLVRVIYLSTHKHARSVYALNPNPARCRDAAIAADAARQARRKSRPPPPKRSRKPR